MRAAIAAYLDHEAKLAEFRGSLLVVHARDDDLVGPHHADLTYAWATSAASRRKVVFDRGGHNGVLVHNWDAYLAALRDFEALLG